MSPDTAHTTPRDAMAQGSATLFTAQVAGNVGYFLAILILARSLGPSGRGVVAFSTVFALIAARVASLGVPTATTYAVARDERSRGQLLTACYAFGISLSTALAGISVLILSVVPGRPSSLDHKILFLIWAGSVASARTSRAR